MIWFLIRLAISTAFRIADRFFDDYRKFLRLRGGWARLRFIAVLVTWVLACGLAELFINDRVDAMPRERIVLNKAEPQGGDALMKPPGNAASRRAASDM